MRCLNCHTDGISRETISCPSCGVVLATLLRDMLPLGALLGGRYRIEHPLGQGGFGITYLGTHIEFDEPVAIKEFYPREHVSRDTTSGGLFVGTRQHTSFQRGLERFRREGQTLKKLRHPNVVSVHDLFSEHGTSYLVMEYLAGRTLSTELQAAAPPGKLQGPLPEARVREIMVSLVNALGVVHDQKTWHLDIKPENIMIGEDGRVVLIDFGAARQEVGSTRKSQACTVAYAPPEVEGASRNAEFQDVDGAEDITLRIGPASDIFELGMTLHEMLTGTLPPDAITRLMRGEKTWAPPGLGEPWRSLIEQALRLDEKTRPKDVRAWWKLTDLKPERGTDDWAEIQLTEEEAKLGCHKAYVSQAGQQGAITIPPRTKRGQVIVDKGHGGAGQYGGEPGDVNIKVLVGNTKAKPTAIIKPEAAAKPVAVAKPVAPAKPAVAPRPLPIGVIAAVSALLLVGVAAFVLHRKKGDSAPPHTAPTTAAATNGEKPSGSAPTTPVPTSVPDKATLNRLLLAEIEANDTQQVRATLKQGADANSSNPDGETALLLAADSGQPQLVRALLDSGAKPQLSDKDGITPLIACAMRGDVETMRVLLSANHDSKFVNARTAKNGYSALMRASARGERQMVKLLMQNGAKAALPSKDGLTARDFASDESIKHILSGG